MATGLVGTSTASNASSNSTVTGATVSYTCPASGVRYAVLNITTTLQGFNHITTSNTSTEITVTAGDQHLRVWGVSTTGGFNMVPSISTHSVILGPSQNWSGSASVYLASSASGFGEARLRVSALEIV